MPRNRRKKAQGASRKRKKEKFSMPTTKRFGKQRELSDKNGMKRIIRKKRGEGSD